MANDEKKKIVPSKTFTPISDPNQIDQMVEYIKEIVILNMEQDNDKSYFISVHPSKNDELTIVNGYLRPPLEQQ